MNTQPPILPGTFERLWTVKNVAEFLQCSRDFVYEHAEDGTLPCLRIGGLLRFEPESIRRWARGELPRARALSLERRQKP
jgi:excisionase family DNA binding protein